MPIPAPDATVQQQSSRFQFGETVVVNARTVSGEDSFGNPTYTTDPTAITNVPVWPRSSGEIVHGRDTLIVGLTALLPVGTDVTAIDSVTVYGVDYEVEGEPGHYSSPFTGLNPGVLVNLTRVA